MKYILFLALFFSIRLVKAQKYEDFEVKVISSKYQNIKGHLKKVAPEGIGVEDYQGNYFILRPNEITKIKVRKRGLTVGEGAGGGALIGLGTGALIWGLDKENENFKEMAVLTGVLTGSGAVIGTVSGVIAEMINTKFTLLIAGDDNKFRATYKQLDKYVNNVLTEHVN